MLFVQQLSDDHPYFYTRKSEYKFWYRAIVQLPAEHNLFYGTDTRMYTLTGCTSKQVDDEIQAFTIVCDRIEAIELVV